LPLRLQVRNCLTKFEIRQVGSRLKGQRWPGEKTYLVPGSGGYLMNGETYVTCRLTAEIAYELYCDIIAGGAKDVGFAETQTEYAEKWKPKDVESALEQLLRYKYFEITPNSDPERIKDLPKLRAHLPYIERVANLRYGDRLGTLSVPLSEESSAQDLSAKEAFRTVDLETCGPQPLLESLGNNHQGMSELLRRLRRPQLVRVHEVHSRDNPESFSASYEGFLDAFGFFLDARKSKNPATFIFGRTVDPEYVKKIHAALTSRREKGLRIECHLLNVAFPLMNFVILEYSTSRGKETEVLFGWGQGLSEGAVFASKDARLVGEYVAFHRRLVDSSEPISVEQIPEKVIVPNLPQ